MFPCLKLRQLEEVLQDVENFEKPKVRLEQYVTPPHLGSHMLFTIQSQYGDIQNKLVADLGSGCGALSIGAAWLEAAYVIGFEIDADALNVYHKNVEYQGLLNIDVVCCDVFKIPARFNKVFDTVIMNPPFGTKNNRGIDVGFLKHAFNISRGTVYSLHKTSTRRHILKFAKSQNVVGEVIANMHYDIPATYRFHRKSSVDVEVDLFRFEMNNIESTAV